MTQPTTHSLNKNRRMASRRRKQAGVTLIELAIAVVVIAATVGMALGGRYLLQFYSGKKEGDIMASALSCARTTWTGNSFTGITLRAMVDNSCFPAENVTDKGSASATANNNFNTAYTVAPATLVGANDAVQITSTNIPSGSCAAAINSANASASRIQVSDGSTTTTVKAAGSPINDASMATACGATTVSVIVAASKAGN